MIVIPEGFAHGFQVLKAGSELLYLHTAFYKPESEGGVRHDDPELGIAWPLPVTDISVRDSTHAYIDTSFRGIVL
jgi:dTDP-4-dehydrorhamnose 3,5-epimerase